MVRDGAQIDVSLIVDARKLLMKYYLIVDRYFYFFFYNPGCSGQLTRTTTNLWTSLTPCKPSRQVRHRGGDRRAQRESNLDTKEGNKFLP